MRKITCFQGHGNSRRCRPHFASSVPSAGRMSLSTVNRGTGSGFQPSFSIRKADLHVSVRDTRSSKRQVWEIDRSTAPRTGPTPPHCSASTRCRRGDISRRELAAMREMHPAVKSCKDSPRHRGLDRIRAHGTDGLPCAVALSVVTPTCTGSGCSCAKRRDVGADTPPDGTPHSRKNGAFRIGGGAGRATPARKTDGHGIFRGAESPAISPEDIFYGGRKPEPIRAETGGGGSGGHYILGTDKVDGT